MFGLRLATNPALLDEEARNANSATKRIVILGDRITAGYGLDSKGAHPTLLQGKIDATEFPKIASHPSRSSPEKKTGFQWPSP